MSTAVSAHIADADSIDNIDSNSSDRSTSTKDSSTIGSDSDNDDSRGKSESKVWDEESDQNVVYVYTTSFSRFRVHNNLV